MSETQKVSLVEIEVNKLSLQPGDVLLAKVSGPAFADEEICEALKQSLKSVFPNNKVGVLFLEGNQVDLSVISQEAAKVLEKASNTEESSCAGANYCSNCNCGKKARADKEFLETVKKVVENHKDAFEKLAESEKQDKLNEEQNGNESN